MNGSDELQFFAIILILSIFFVDEPSGDSKMITSQKRFGRHLVTKTVAERDFAMQSHSIDVSERLSLHRLKLERTKVWEDLRRINVKTRSLRRASLIEREIQAERNKLSDRQHGEKPSPAAIGQHLASSLVITGVQPQPRPTFRDQDGRVVRPKTSASPRVTLNAQHTDALRPKTAGAFATSARLDRGAQEFLSPAMSRQLVKADRLAESLDTLQIRHYLSPDELVVLEREKTLQRRAKSCQPFSPRLRRHVTGSVPMRSSYDDVSKMADSNVNIMSSDSIQPKRLLSRERNPYNWRRKSLSLDDIRKTDALNADAACGHDTGTFANKTEECHIGDSHSEKAYPERRYASDKESIKKYRSEKVVKLPSPEMDSDIEGENGG